MTAPNYAEMLARYTIQELEVEVAKLRAAEWIPEWMMEKHRESFRRSNPNDPVMMRFYTSLMIGHILGLGAPDCRGHDPEFIAAICSPVDTLVDRLMWAHDNNRPYPLDTTDETLFILATAGTGGAS